MQTPLLRTRAALDDCEKHLQASGALGTEIEVYLAQYLVVILCADVQQGFYSLSESRAATAADTGISSFVAASSRKILRSVGKGEIATYIGTFGSDCKNKMNSQLDDAEVTIYNNAVTNRHEVAHNQGALISFGEFKNAVDVAEKILKAAAFALDLGPALAAANASAPVSIS